MEYTGLPYTNGSSHLISPIRHFREVGIGGQGRPFFGLRNSVPLATRDVIGGEERQIKTWRLQSLDWTP